MSRDQRLKNSIRKLDKAYLDALGHLDENGCEEELETKFIQLQRFMRSNKKRNLKREVHND